MHVTLQDVARHAGMSAKTVSRVVNNQGEISSATRARVQAAIQELGYRPNILARSLVHRRTDTLAVVAWGINFFGPSRAVLGVEQQSDELGYSLFLSLATGPEDARTGHVLDTLVARRVDGIIWAIPEVGSNRSWFSGAQLKELPPIVFLTMRPRRGLPVVAVNNHHGAVCATQHLVERGRRRIGLIAGPLKWWEARERVAGRKQALDEAGIAFSDLPVVEGDWSAASGARAMKALFERTPHLDAVFACNDQMALGALGAAQAAGRHVPDDLAVVGFGNVPESEFYSPPLTTVNQALIEAGRIATRRLHELIEARRAGELETGEWLHLLKPELVVRASSG